MNPQSPPIAPRTIDEKIKRIIAYATTTVRTKYRHEEKEMEEKKRAEKAESKGRNKETPPGEEDEEACHRLTRRR
jgi:hypothetical protein